MPRLSRIDIPDTVYHVYTRGNNKAAIFLDYQDRVLFLKFLDRALERHPCDLLGYCLMDNHYHLQLKTLEDPLGLMMHYLNNLYAGYFNDRYGRTGHVFQGRFHSIPVQADAYLLALSRYIHLNPVVAGIVQSPEQYAWSSYRDYVQDFQSVIKTDLVLNTLSPQMSQQRHLYRQFVEEHIGRPPQFRDHLLTKIRVLGSDAFIRAVRAKAPSAFPQQELKEKINALY
jgi:putative transposase